MLALSSLSCQGTPEGVEKMDLAAYVDSDATALESEISSPKMDYWRTQRRGANSFTPQYKPDYFKAAKEAGIEFIRFGPNQLPSAERDFLFGDMENFTEINSRDLACLKDILDDAHSYGIKIILTMFELPGHRQGESDEGKRDTRLWREQKYWEQSFQFWEQLARALKDHPAIVAYNPINEPYITYVYGKDYPAGDFPRWLERTKGTTADLNLFNRLMVRAIRKADSQTPIMLDGYFWADPKAINFTELLEDRNTLYSFHNPSPWEYASLGGNKGRYSYPGRMPAYGNSQEGLWEKSDLEGLLSPVHQFIEDENIEPWRIIAGEFWCNRRVPGCDAYMSDMISLYEERQWHWAFWSFRDNGSWNGLDYELGDAPDPGLYYIDTVRKGEDSEKYRLRRNTPSWEVIRKGLAGGENAELDTPTSERPDMTPWLKDLESEDMEVRKSALLALRLDYEAAEEALPQIVKYLGDEEGDVRATAAFTLSAWGDEAPIAVKPLIKCLSDPEWKVRDAAALALAAVGEEAREALPSLIGITEDEEWFVRRSALYALSKIGSPDDPGLSLILEKALKDPEEHVRIEAALAQRRYESKALNL